MIISLTLSKNKYFRFVFEFAKLYLFCIHFGLSSYGQLFNYKNTTFWSCIIFSNHSYCTFLSSVADTALSFDKFVPTIAVLKSVSSMVLHTGLVLGVSRATFTATCTLHAVKPAIIKKNITSFKTMIIYCIVARSIYCWWQKAIKVEYEWFS